MHHVIIFILIRKVSITVIHAAQLSNVNVICDKSEMFIGWVKPETSL